MTTDRARFIHVAGVLLSALPFEQAELIRREFKACGEAVDEGRVWDPHPLAGAAIRVILEHLAVGFPLQLPPPVAQFYLDVAAGKQKLEPALWQCAECGYGLPHTFATCPLCGGATGPGAHSIRRSLKAGLN